MDYEEAKKKASELDGQFEDVMLDVGELNWPWRPFAVPDKEELNEIRRRRIAKSLSGRRPGPERISLLTDLVRLGGYHVIQGSIELEDSPFHLFGYFSAIEKFGDMDDFLKPFDDAGFTWDEDQQPDWSDVERLLLGELGVDPCALANLTLVDIRRYLLARQLRTTRKQNPRVKTSGKRRSTKLRLLTPKEEEAFELRKQGLSYRAIGMRLGIKRQAVADRVLRAKRVTEMMRGEANRSVRTKLAGDMAKALKAHNKSAADDDVEDRDRDEGE